MRVRACSYRSVERGEAFATLAVAATALALCLLARGHAAEAAGEFLPNDGLPQAAAGDSCHCPTPPRSPSKRPPFPPAALADVSSESGVASDTSQQGPGTFRKGGYRSGRTAKRRPHCGPLRQVSLSRPLRIVFCRWVI